MQWTTFTSIVGVAANLATIVAAAGIVQLFRQIRGENRARAKESNQAIWDLLGSEEVYRAKSFIEMYDPPDDLGEATRAGSPWIDAALRCYLAYTKASVLVIRHHWMKEEDFAVWWGFATLVVWRRLSPWIAWYRTSRSYPAFGNSIDALAKTVLRYDSRFLGFEKEVVGTLPGSPMPRPAQVRIPYANIAGVPNEP